MNIAYRCKINGLTQREFAKQIGVSDSLVSKWCCRSEVPRARFLPVLADFFGITVEELLSDREDIDLKLLDPDPSKKPRGKNQANDWKEKIEADLVDKIEELIPEVYDLETAEIVKCLAEAITLLKNGR